MINLFASWHSSLPAQIIDTYLYSDDPTNQDQTNFRFCQYVQYHPKKVSNLMAAQFCKMLDTRTEEHPKKTLIIKNLKDLLTQSQNKKIRPSIAEKALQLAVSYGPITKEQFNAIKKKAQEEIQAEAIFVIEFDYFVREDVPYELKNELCRQSTNNFALKALQIK